MRLNDKAASRVLDPVLTAFSRQRPRRHALSSFVPIDAAVKNMQHAVGVLGDIGFVRHQDYGVSLAVKLIEEPHYLLRSL